MSKTENVREIIVVPYAPRVVPNEELYVYIPLASKTQAGVATFDDKYFIVSEGHVSLSSDVGGGSGVVEEVDPTVPDWAKQPEKPTYTYAELKEKPSLLSLGEKSGTAYDGAKGKQNATDIAALKTSVAGKQDALVFDGTYNASTNKVATVQTVADSIAVIVAGANTSFDTLKEIADWILAHPNDVAALNAAIKTNADNIALLQSGKQDKLTETDKNQLIADVIAALPIYDGSVTDV